MSHINKICKCDIKRQELSSIDMKLLTEIESVIYFTDGNGYNENIIITKYDQVFGFGTNSNGRLGLGTTTKIVEPTKIPELFAKKIIKVGFGNNFMAALTKSGDVYTCGYDNDGLLGNGLNSGTYTKPEKINLNNEFITDIKCCITRTILLTQKNQIYWFGNRQNTNQTNTPTHLDNFNDEKIIQISTGHDHVLALAESGIISSWGVNTYGELGLGHENISDIPQQIQMSGVLFRQISCGYHHNLGLTEDGIIYSFGYNASGQLGTGNVDNLNVPTPLTFSEKFIEIFAAQNMSFALTESLSIYVWGQTKQNDKVLSPLKTDMNSFQEAIDFYGQNSISYKPLTSTDIFIEKPINRLIKMITKAFNNPENSDLKFRVKRKVSQKFDYIYGHKWFIEENSKHFKTIIANNIIEETYEIEPIEVTELMEKTTPKTIQIAINDYSYEAYYQFIKSLYSDSIETEDIEVLTELLSITDEYMDEEMKLKCVEKVKPLTTLLNVCNIYSCALKYKSKELEEYCFEMMSNNIKSIIETEDYEQMDSTFAKNFFTKYFQLKTV